jgi:NADH:ubiquinone oxidoreductase subunit 3 (subunit A)
MITYIAIGIGFLVVVAVVVGIVDAAQAAQWRRVARERRERWESRQRQYTGYDSGSYSIDEEDDD